MRTAISIIGYDKCTGCFGCMNVCNTDAIGMPLDMEGFYKPVIDESKCTNCGICEKRCPVINYISPNSGHPKVYAGWSNDDTIRLSSSSGGVFSEIAKVIIKRGGVVFGVNWRNGLVEYSYTETIEGLSAYRGSKYLQANVGMAYKQVKEFIKNGREVLFTGVPCQVAALRNIVKSDKLITVDLACLGIPSIKVYQKFIKENFYNKNITHTNFRSKSTGWVDSTIEYWSNSELMGSDLKSNDLFFYGFSPDCLYINTACYECKFNTMPRCGDITLADFWGVSKAFYSPLGVSAVFVNNSNFEMFINKLDISLREQHVKDVLLCNKRLNRAVHVSMPKNRVLFFRDINSKSFIELASLYFSRPNRFKQLAYRFIWKIKKLILKIKRNY